MLLRLGHPLRIGVLVVAPGLGSGDLPLHGDSLVGGPTVLRIALALGILDRVHLPRVLGGGHPLRVATSVLFLRPRRRGGAFPVAGLVGGVGVVDRRRSAGTVAVPAAVAVTTAAVPAAMPVTASVAASTLRAVATRTLIPAVLWWRHAAGGGGAVALVAVVGRCTVPFTGTLGGLRLGGGSLGACGIRRSLGSGFGFLRRTRGLRSARRLLSRSLLRSVIAARSAGSRAARAAARRCGLAAGGRLPRR